MSQRCLSVSRFFILVGREKTAKLPEMSQISGTRLNMLSMYVHGLGQLRGLFGCCLRRIPLADENPGYDVLALIKQVALDGIAGQRRRFLHFVRGVRWFSDSERGSVKTAIMEGECHQHCCCMHCTSNTLLFLIQYFIRTIRCGGIRTPFI